MSIRKNQHGSDLSDPLKDATMIALKRVVNPLVDLMFDAGITVREFSQLSRESAVRNATRRVTKEIGRDSKSRVAIITGLPRSEVARILRRDDISPGKRLGQHPVRKVLAAWFDNPRFLEATGDPAILPIFGKRRSFEQLVTRHSGGIPVRAMLDELTRIEAVERLSDQRVKAISRVPILSGLTSNAIAVIGERAGDLLETLTSNLKGTSKPLFEGTALLEEIDLDSASLIRREIAEQGASFISSANSLLSRSRIRPNKSVGKSSAKYRLGVTVYYFQDSVEAPKKTTIEAKYRSRKNLRRKSRPLRQKGKMGAMARSLKADS
jgi:hypothetical protein